MIRVQQELHSLNLDGYVLIADVSLWNVRYYTLRHPANGNRLRLEVRGTNIRWYRNDKLVKEVNYNT